VITRKEGVYLEKAGNAANTAAKWSAAGQLIGTGSNLLASRYGFSGGGTGARTISASRSYQSPAMAGPGLG
jgi:hypothetical protein